MWDAQVVCFPELEAAMRSAIEELGGRVVPKLNWSCPKVGLPPPTSPPPPTPLLPASAPLSPSLLVVPAPTLVLPRACPQRRTRHG